MHYFNGLPEALTWEMEVEPLAMDSMTVMESGDQVVLRSLILRMMVY